MEDEARKEVLGEQLMSELQAIRENTDRVHHIEGRLGRVGEGLSDWKPRSIVSEAVKEHLADKSLHNEISWSVGGNRV